jgi:hypothetical protein
MVMSGIGYGLIFDQGSLGEIDVEEKAQAAKHHTSATSPDP